MIKQHLRAGLAHTAIPVIHYTRALPPVMVSRPKPEPEPIASGETVNYARPAND